MKAIAIYPGKGEPHFTDIPKPRITESRGVLLETLQVGICGTDRAEVTGGRALAEKDSSELIIGHEMIGRVVETGKDVKNIKTGDFAMLTVRRGCGKCYPCAHNRNDMCYTGDYLERGIKGLNGFQAEFILDDEANVVKIPGEISHIGVLTEPMSVVEKAIDEALNLQRTRIPGMDETNRIRDKKVLIAGLGPVGLLAAIILKIKGARLFGVDIVDEKSPRAKILTDLGGSYINGKETRIEDIDDKCGRFDLILEATGVAKLGFQLPESLETNGVFIITGIPEGEKPLTILAGQIMSNLVLNNQLLLGTVNAGIEHYKMAVEDLIIADKKWPSLVSGIITEKVPAAEFEKAFAFSENEIKTVIEWKSF